MTEHRVGKKKKRGCKLGSRGGVDWGGLGRNPATARLTSSTRIQDTEEKGEREDSMN